MDEVLDHIVRPPLPWRDPQKTECGRPLNDVASAVDGEAIVHKIKEQGQQRAAMSTCMTCASTSRRWKRWTVDPIEAMSRAMASAQYDDMEGDLTRRELLAIAELIARHRYEFDGMVSGLTVAIGATTDLAAVRRAKITRSTRGRR